MALPLVSIAMPAYNEERFIETCIGSVQAQDYPADRIEILAELAIVDPRIRVVDNPERLQAAGLNKLIREARGDIVVRMDVHCEYAPSYVRKCVETMEKTGADNVGGAQRARAKNPFQRALCAALASPLGVGGAGYRDASKEGFVDTVFLGAFRRKIFETIGLYDPKAITNEDAELNQRLLESGGKIYLSKEIEVHYYPRDSFKTLARQYYKYGRGRARTLLKLGRFPTIRPAIPFLMVVGGATLLVVPPLWPIAPVALAAYALATGAEAVRVGGDLGPGGIATVWGILPTLHVSHGIGFAAGLIRYLRDPDWAPLEMLEPTARAQLRVV